MVQVLGAMLTLSTVHQVQSVGAIHSVIWTIQPYRVVVLIMLELSRTHGIRIFRIIEIPVRISC